MLRRLLRVLPGLAAVPAALAQEPAAKPEPRPDPRPEVVLVTAATRADPAARALLEQPGEVLFRDDFEAPDALAKYFEVRYPGADRARVVFDEGLAHRGRGALQLRAPANDGKSSGAGASGWLGNAGHDRVHLRYYLKFAADYDQGHLNHTGGHLVAVTGENKWAGMGTAGQRPAGDDRFSSSFEAWRDWGRVAAPGSMHLYTYWMDMRVDRDGNYWGNLLQPPAGERVVPERGRWTCYEFMLRAGTPGEHDGELAAWIDGALYAHFQGLRWRTSPDVKLKRFGLDVYVHQAVRDNMVLYDDVVVSTGYVGPERAAK